MSKPGESSVSTLSKPIPIRPNNSSPLRPRSYSDNTRRGEGDYRGKNFRSDNGKPHTYGGNYQTGPSTPSGYRQNPPPQANSNYSRSTISNWSKTAPDIYSDYKSYKKSSSDKDAARKQYRNSSGTDKKSLGEVLRFANNEVAGRQGHLQKYPRALPDTASYRDHEKRIRDVRNTANNSRSNLTMLLSKEARKAKRAAAAAQPPTQGSS